ncbi:MAG: hypothetical protein J7L46_06355, partial [Bacteroidales bacterium]|nr:hypothetical protein [Bacteroidales bacterium]
MKKIFKWLLILFVIIAVLIVGTGAVITYFYKDEVVGLVIDEINKSLQTQVDVKEISFTVFKHFPDASLVFDEVLVHSPKNFSGKDFYRINTDTLLFAKNLSLDFNLIDIIKKKYSFHRIGIESGKINLFIAKSGKNNLDIFKSDSSGTSANIKVDLQKILLSGVRLQIRNAYQEMILLSQISKADVSGNFSAEKFNFNTSAEVFINDFTNDGVNFVTNKRTTLDIGFNYSNNTYKIEDGKVGLEDLRFELSGDFKVTSITNLNLTVKADDISIEKLLSLLPEKYAGTIKDYDGKGNLQFNATVSGVVDYKQSPHIEASYSIHDGELIYQPNDFALSGIRFSG